MAEVNSMRSGAGSRRSPWRTALRLSAIPVLALSVAIGSPAAADDKVAPAAQAGLLVLPNVRIQSATPAQLKQASARNQDQGRAFKDKDTGQLRAPTPEELIRSASEPETASPPVEIRTLPDGSRMAALGDEAMAHSVVHRDADGALHKECVAGAKSASKALSTPVAPGATR